MIARFIVAQISSIFVILLCLLVCSSGIAQGTWNPVSTELDISINRSITAQLVKSQDGTLAVGVISVSGERGDTEFPIKRHSDVEVIFSKNQGTSWTAPQVLSDNRFLNTELSLVGGEANSFSFAWNSGDAMSGFRLHTGSTVDGGNSFTSQTHTQNLDALNMGYLYPTIAHGDSTEVVTVTGFRQDANEKPMRGSVYTRPIGSTSWDTFELNLPQTSSTENIVFSGATAAAGSNVLVAYVHTDNFGFQAKPILKCMASTNDGTDWETNDLVSTETINLTSLLLRTNGDGTWILTYKTQNDYRLRILKSTDLGKTWTNSAVNIWYSEVQELATDGMDRWLALLSAGRYLVSEDDGDTWSPILVAANNVIPFQIEYIGNGVWGALAYGASPNAAPLNYYTMQWGDSVVDEWSLY